MDRRLLLAINIIGALAFLVLYLTGIVPFSPYLASIIFLALLYVNIRQAALDFIDYNMVMDVIPVDVTRDDRLRNINYLVLGAVLAAGLAICGVCYLLLPAEQLVWAVTFSVYLLLAAGLLEVFIGINYLLLGRVIMNNLSMAAAVVIALLLLGIAWIFLPREQFMYALILGMVVILLPALYFNGRVALAIAKKVNEKPVKTSLERNYKIFNSGALLVLLALIIGVRFLPPQLHFLSMLVIPIFLLLLVVNAWKLISDIRPNTSFNTGRR